MRRPGAAPARRCAPRRGRGTCVRIGRRRWWTTSLRPPPRRPPLPCLSPSQRLGRLDTSSGRGVSPRTAPVLRAGPGWSGWSHARTRSDFDWTMDALGHRTQPNPRPRCSIAAIESPEPGGCDSRRRWDKEHRGP
eukprot:1190070-Prorocentrum_minimum.AAC.1